MVTAKPAAFTPTVAEAAAPPVLESVFAQTFAKSSMPRVDLSEPFPKAPKVVPTAQIANDTITSTTLASGLKVATMQTTDPVSSIGIFVDSGSRYDHPKFPGISHFFSTLMLKSTRHRSHLKMTRDMNSLGATSLW